MDLNKAQVRGRLGQRPEVRYTGDNTAVANLSIATSRTYKSNGEKKEDTEWHRVVLWGRLAEVAQEYADKGSLVYVEGRLQTKKWEDKEGRDRYTTEIVGYRLDLLGNSKGGNGAGNSQKSRGKGSQDFQEDLDEDFDDIDDELPF